MLDFTSALYLGMRHASERLGPWGQFTTGVPAALSPPPLARPSADALARLQGCERATLSPSTLHLFWDLFGAWGAQGAAVFFDAGLYPVGRWGVERAAARGAPVRSFPHHDADALRALLRRHATARRRTTIVTDGFCPGCGAHAPVKDYFELARDYGGRLVMDDTQAIGIFGSTNPTDSTGAQTTSEQSPVMRAPAAPYGFGGGGTLRRFDLSGPSVLSISSLAKGFGVPVAVLAGGREEVADFERASETRTHCSPPSNAVLSALAHALCVNRRRGDALRLRLCRLVGRFRALLRGFGLSTGGGLFPVQTLAGRAGQRAAEIHDALEGRGVRAVLRRDRCHGGTRLSFVLNALHTPETIELAARSLALAAGACAPTPARGGYGRV